MGIIGSGLMSNHHPKVSATEILVGRKRDIAAAEAAK